MLMLKTLTYWGVCLPFPVYYSLQIMELLKKQRNRDNKLSGLWMVAITSRRIWRYILVDDFPCPNSGKSECNMQKHKCFQACKNYNGKNKHLSLFSLFHDL